jgi:23S rRNA pseudouridine1911/1915/1917 synthase
MAAGWTLEKNILAETVNWVAVNKSSGMLSIPDRFNQAIPSVLSLLQKKFGEIYTVHRLDKDTSGVIIYAKNREYHKWLSQGFESRQVLKHYVALVSGRVRQPAGTIDLPLTEHPAVHGKMIIAKKGKQARTDYELVEDFNLYSLLKIRIYTGRTHQIRVHLANLGHPVVGDSLYGSPAPVYLSRIKTRYRPVKDQEKEIPLLDRLALHAFQIQFPDPSGESVTLEAPLHKDMNAVLSQLRKNASPQE